MSVRRLLIGILLIAVPAVSQEVPLEKRAADYLVAHFQSPEDYVISKFKTHDIGFLGESTHGVRQTSCFSRS